MIYGDHIFQLADDAVLSAINKHTGHALLDSAARQTLGVLACGRRRTPSTPRSSKAVTPAARADRRAQLETGAVRWFRSLPSKSESSPLLDHGRLYFGTQNGTVYALDARNGHVLWTYHASGSVKASPTLCRRDALLRRLLRPRAGDLRATGQRIWRSSSGGALLGSGTFYSTAAVVYGRVFLGNTDGRVYAYDAFTGRLDWAVQTGAYVYASPAVTNAPGLGPTIYVGSYSGTFYAINARSGTSAGASTRTGESPARRRSSAIVYFADLGQHRTYGLGISTGRALFQLDTGAFDPAISDGVDLFLTGDTGLYALAPVATTAPATPGHDPPHRQTIVTKPSRSAHTSRQSRARERARSERRRQRARGQ